MPELPRNAATQTRRLLCVLLVWFREVPPEAGGRKLLFLVVAQDSPGASVNSSFGLGASASQRIFNRRSVLDHLPRHGQEAPEDRVPRVRVIPDPAQLIEHDGIHHVEEQVVAGEVVHDRSVPRPVAGVSARAGRDRVKPTQVPDFAARSTSMVACNARDISFAAILFPSMFQ